MEYITYTLVGGAREYDHPPVYYFTNLNVAYQVDILGKYRFNNFGFRLCIKPKQL